MNKEAQHYFFSGPIVTIFTNPLGSLYILDLF